MCFLCEGAHVCMSEKKPGSYTHSKEKKKKKKITAFQLIMSNKKLKSKADRASHLTRALGPMRVLYAYVWRLHACACLLHDIKWVSLVMNNIEAYLNAQCRVVWWWWLANLRAVIRLFLISGKSECFFLLWSASQYTWPCMDRVVIMHHNLITQ